MTNLSHPVTNSEDLSDGEEDMDEEDSDDDLLDDEDIDD